ncbi:MAG: hypothetical protein PHY72_02720 [Candidatus Pacebacteria bacterium]|nr:hypothetical protein [Candidatus Paceibacterota bacterium]
MRKPNTQDLQNFTKEYFKKNPPIVKWKKIDCNGLADTENNIIYLNPENSEKEFGCQVTEGSYKPKTRIRFKDGEQYFAVLLHEIAEFKFYGKIKPPKCFKEIKNKIIKKLRREAVEKSKKLKTEYKEPTLDDVAYLAQDCFEDPGDHCEFRAWLLGRLNIDHIKVEDWAVQKFKKRRKDIAILLSD